MCYSLRPGLARSADIRAADVVKCLPEKVGTIVPSEAAVRELGKAEPGRGSKRLLPGGVEVASAATQSM
jgi:hypothetical protein